jgi:hypothetical protein
MHIGAQPELPETLETNFFKMEKEYCCKLLVYFIFNSESHTLLSLYSEMEIINNMQIFLKGNRIPISHWTMKDTGYLP